MRGATVCVHNRLFLTLLLINTTSLHTLTLFVTSQQFSQQAVVMLEMEDYDLVIQYMGEEMASAIFKNFVLL